MPINVLLSGAHLDELPCRTCALSGLLLDNDRPGVDLFGIKLPSNAQTVEALHRILDRSAREFTACILGRGRPRVGFTRFLLRLLGRGFVVLLLLLLFLFRQLLLLVLVLVFLATLVSHTCSFFSDCDLKVWITTRLIIRNRREPTRQEESLQPNSDFPCTH
jgi:hypothetical protein